MRRYGLYDTTRGLTTAIAAGTAGLLLWSATQIGQQTTSRFWEAMGVVVAAGLVFSLARVVAGWMKGLRARFSLGTFLLGFVPVLVVAGWILLATQPGSGWEQGRFASWSSSIGVMGVVHSLGLWHGVLAFGTGLVLGLAIDNVPALVEEDVTIARHELTRTPVTAPGTVTVPDARAEDRVAADDPLSADRDVVRADEARTVAVGPADEQA